jgi:tetratricopeptide (TPR) repeat protein
LRRRFPDTAAFLGNSLSVLAAILGWLAASGSGYAEGSALEPAWDKASKLLTNEALVEFESVRAAGGADAREATLGSGLMLLNTQPKTEGNLDKAVAYFDEVSGSGDDDLAMIAGYYRARVDQVHRLSPDLGKARELFTVLVEKDPAHPVAQYAIVKRAMIDIYDSSPLETKRERLDALARQAPQLSHLPARRDLHLLLAHAYGRLLEDDRKTLEQLLAADQIGITRSKPRAGIWVQIGELARLTGERELAMEYYRRFLESYKRDNRHYTIEQKLKQLETETESMP